MTDHTLPDRLRYLAESLVGDEWEHPVDAVETCRRAADELERLRRERDEARDAARWWYRRDRTGHDPSAITDQHALWPWLADDTLEDRDA